MGPLFRDRLAADRSIGPGVMPEEVEAGSGGLTEEVVGKRCVF